MPLEWWDEWWDYLPVVDLAIESPVAVEKVRVTPRIRSTSYLSEVLNPSKLPGIVSRIEARIAESGIEYDAIAFRGLSGSIVGPMLAWLTGKHMLAVRKGEHSHSCYRVEGVMSEGLRYIIVDDLIDSGDTMNSIYDAVRQANEDEELVVGMRPVGIFLYHAINDDRDFTFILENSPTIPIFRA